MGGWRVSEGIRSGGQFSPEFAYAIEEVATEVVRPRGIERELDDEQPTPASEEEGQPELIEDIFFENAPVTDRFEAEEPRSDRPPVFSTWIERWAIAAIAALPVLAALAAMLACHIIGQ